MENILPPDIAREITSYIPCIHKGSTPPNVFAKARRIIPGLFGYILRSYPLHDHEMEELYDQMEIDTTTYIQHGIILLKLHVRVSYYDKYYRFYLTKYKDGRKHICRKTLDEKIVIPPGHFCHVNFHILKRTYKKYKNIRIGDYYVHAHVYAIDDPF